MFSGGGRPENFLPGGCGGWLRLAVVGARCFPAQPENSSPGGCGGFVLQYNRSFTQRRKGRKNHKNNQSGFFGGLCVFA